MNAEEVDRICEAFLYKEVIETPFGTMTGRPTIAGSRIPYAGYTLEYGGKTVPVNGLCWGHGTLFIVTEKGHENIKIPYILDRPTVCEDDEEFPEDEDEEDCQTVTARQSTLDCWS